MIYCIRNAVVQIYNSRIIKIYYSFFKVIKNESLNKSCLQRFCFPQHNIYII